MVFNAGFFFSWQAGCDISLGLRLEPKLSAARKCAASQAQAVKYALITQVELTGLLDDSVL